MKNKRLFKADFLDIANYLNEDGRYFNEEEIKQYAHDYFCEYRDAKKGDYKSDILESLVELLQESFIFAIVGTEEHANLEKWIDGIKAVNR